LPKPFQRVIGLSVPLSHDVRDQKWLHTGARLNGRALSRKMLWFLVVKTIQQQATARKRIRVTSMAEIVAGR